MVVKKTFEKSKLKHYLLKIQDNDLNEYSDLVIWDTFSKTCQIL